MVTFKTPLKVNAHITFDLVLLRHGRAVSLFVFGNVLDDERDGLILGVSSRLAGRILPSRPTQQLETTRDQYLAWRRAYGKWALPLLTLRRRQETLFGEMNSANPDWQRISAQFPILERRFRDIAAEAERSLPSPSPEIGPLNQQIVSSLRDYAKAFALLEKAYREGDAHAGKRADRAFARAERLFQDANTKAVRIGARLGVQR